MLFFFLNSKVFPLKLPTQCFFNVLLPFFSAQKAAKTAPADEYLISPITGEKIPASQVQKHMRIGLLDRSWIEQRDKHIQEKRNQETVFAPGKVFNPTKIYSVLNIKVTLILSCSISTNFQE